MFEENKILGQNIFWTEGDMCEITRDRIYELCDTWVKMLDFCYECTAEPWDSSQYEWHISYDVYQMILPIMDDKINRISVLLRPHREKWISLERKTMFGRNLLSSLSTLEGVSPCYIMLYISDKVTSDELKHGEWVMSVGVYNKLKQSCYLRDHTLFMNAPIKEVINTRNPFLMLQKASEFKPGMVLKNGSYLQAAISTLKLQPEIKKVIHNNPATIVFWTDGDKTVVKCQEGDEYDPEKGLAMAISKKALGKGYYDEFKKWLPEEEEEQQEYVSPFKLSADGLKELSKALASGPNSLDRYERCIVRTVDNFNNMIIHELLNEFSAMIDVELKKNNSNFMDTSNYKFMVTKRIYDTLFTNYTVKSVYGINVELDYGSANTITLCKKREVKNDKNCKDCRYCGLNWRYEEDSPCFVCGPTHINFRPHSKDTDQCQ